MVRKTENTETSRADFARRLRRFRLAKEIRQAELARRVALHMPGNRFGRSLISKYENGDTMPSLLALNALAKVLDVRPEDLVPETPELSEAMPEDTKAHFRSVDDDSVHVRVNQRLPRALGLKIIMMIDEYEREKE